MARTKTIYTFFIFSLFTASTASAIMIPSAQPPAHEVERVVNYYMNGAAQGPVVSKIEICSHINMVKGPNQYACLDPITDKLKKNTRYYTVLSSLVPLHAKYNDVTVQYLYRNFEKDAHELSLASSLRFHSVIEEAFNQAGEWEVRVLRNDKQIYSTKVTVAE